MFVPLMLRKIQIQCYHSQVDGLEDRSGLSHYGKSLGSSGNPGIFGN